MGLSLTKPVLVGSSINFSMFICILEYNVNTYLFMFLISSFLILFFIHFVLYWHVLQNKFLFAHE